MTIQRTKHAGVLDYLTQFVVNEYRFEKFSLREGTGDYCHGREGKQRGYGQFAVKREA